MKINIRRLKRQFKDNIRKKHLIIFFIVSFGILSSFFLINMVMNFGEEKVSRLALFSETWYPEDKKELEKTIESFFDNVKQNVNKEIKAIIVPHAAYKFSGQVAATGFKQLNKDYDEVFIIASNHFGQLVLRGVSVPTFTHYSTPLGDVKVSEITIYFYPLP